MTSRIRPPGCGYLLIPHPKINHNSDGPMFMLSPALFPCVPSGSELIPGFNGYKTCDSDGPAQQPAGQSWQTSVKFQWTVSATWTVLPGILLRLEEDACFIFDY